MANPSCSYRRKKCVFELQNNIRSSKPALSKVIVETLEFSPLEREIYSSVYHNARHQFQSLDAKGQVGKNWQSIFALLMRYYFLWSIQYETHLSADFVERCYTLHSLPRQVLRTKGMTRHPGMPK